jgi:hypothetical protein
MLSRAMAKTAAQPANVEPSTLQFESADFGAGAAPSSCARCAGALADAYWAVNGNAVCARCRDTVAQAVAPGGDLGRFLRATALGALGGLGGAGVYFAVGRATGYEFSLLAILVGWLVGTGVHRGSRGRGGFAYQALAVVLTYGAIVSTYVPTLVSEIRHEIRKHEAASAAGDHATDAPAEVAPEEAEVAPAATADAGEASMSPILGMVLASAFLFALACAMPFFGGTSNLMGLVIIAIGLHQAWTLNRRPKLEITGPHALARA